MPILGGWWYMPIFLSTHFSLAIIRQELTLNFFHFIWKKCLKFSRLFCHYLTACLQFSPDTSDENKSCLFCHYSKLSNVPKGSYRLAVFFFIKMRGKHVKEKIKPIWHRYFLRKHHKNYEFRRTPGCPLDKLFWFWRKYITKVQKEIMRFPLLLLSLIIVIKIFLHMFYRRLRLFQNPENILCFQIATM